MDNCESGFALQGCLATEYFPSLSAVSSYFVLVYCCVILTEFGVCPWISIEVSNRKLHGNTSGVWGAGGGGGGGGGADTCGRTCVEKL